MKHLIITLFLAMSFSQASDKTKLSLEYWAKLDKNQKKEILDDLQYEDFDDTYSDFKIIKFEDLKDLSSVYYKPYRDYLELVFQNIGEISTEEIEQRVGAETGSATVGDPRKEIYLLVTLSTHQVLGSYIRLFQKGAQKENASWDEDFHFENLDEAKKANFDTDADIEWQAYTSIDENGNLLKEDAAFEWSGH